MRGLRGRLSNKGKSFEVEDEGRGGGGGARQRKLYMVGQISMYSFMNHITPRSVKISSHGDTNQVKEKRHVNKYRYWICIMG